MTMKQRFVGAIFLFACGILTTPTSAAEVDFEMEIRPILETACVHCHNAERAEGDLRLDSLQAAIEGGSNGTALVPGDAEASPLFTTTILPPDDDEIMPPDASGKGEGAGNPLAARCAISPR